MNWHDTPYSSHISGYAYDDDQNRLFIEFKQTHIYRYEAVPKPVYQGFKQADSKGKYFNHAIKNHYNYCKLNDREHVERDEVTNCQLELFRSDCWR